MVHCATDHLAVASNWNCRCNAVTPRFPIFSTGCFVGEFHAVCYWNCSKIGPLHHLCTQIEPEILGQILGLGFVNGLTLDA